MLERGGNVDVALSLAQAARKGLPEQPTTADTLAWAYYKKGAFQSAVDLLEETVRQAPSNPNFHYHLGLVYQALNRGAKAQEQLNRALALDPKFPHAADARKVLGRG
jgi:tetratricopeptide (TPR) repeat protein